MIVMVVGGGLRESELLEGRADAVEQEDEARHRLFARERSELAPSASAT